MYRPPSKHGLEKKYKPWRRGKSKNAKTSSSSSSSSLKQQLRGQERLLTKIPPQEQDRRQELFIKIKDLEQQIAEKQAADKERQNATKSHGIRFLERQRLTRLERQARTNAADSLALYKIALDQVYVAHFPHSVRYIPLFKRGVRLVDTGKTLYKRAVTRNRIFKNLTQADRVSWISSDQYQRVPSSWSIQEEKNIFGTTEETTDEQETSKLVQDDRFALQENHQHLLTLAEEIENQLDQEEKEGSDVVDKDHFELDFQEDDRGGDDDGDEADPIAPSPPKQPRLNLDDSVQNDLDSSDNDSSSSSSSSSRDSSEDSLDDDNDDTRQEHPQHCAPSHHTETHAPATDNFRKKGEQNDEEFDDFFMPPTDDNVFEKAQHERAETMARGDKSKGWATQRQRPGEWQKNKRRRK